MSDPKKTPTPREVYTLPWEQPGGDTDLQAAAEAYQARQDAEESGDEPVPPTDTEEATPAKDEKSDADSDEDEEDTDDESTASDAEDESNEEDEDDSDEAEPDSEVIDLGDEKVTRKELKDRGLRQADYTRKTQALADERRSFEAEAQAVRGEREQYQERLEVLHQVLEKAKGPQVDWVKLARENPQEYAVRKAEHDRIEQQQAAVAKEHAQVVQKQRADAVNRRERVLTEERVKLVEAIPTWQDAQVAEKEQGELADYAMGLGFTEQNLDLVEDHRVFLMLRKAMLYDRQQAQEVKVAKEIKAKAKAPKGSLKPGVKRGPGKKSKASEKRLVDARARLQKSGSLEDAAAVFTELFGDD
jgi:hypothetical protein